MWTLILTAVLQMAVDIHQIPLPNRELCEQVRIEIVGTQPLMDPIVLTGVCVKNGA